jgi:hypothetical protein
MKAETDKIAAGSPRYARLLASARDGQARRRDLARFLQTRRNDLQLEQVMQSLSLAG